MNASRAADPAETSGLAELDPEFRPEAVRVIADVETLKVLSDPLRLRIIETMVQRAEPAWSVKELAAALDVPPTRLYHHVEQLTEHDLVRPVERRVVSGIIETRYRVVALSFQLDRRMFAGGTEESRVALRDTVATVLESARHEIEVSLHLGTIDLTDTAPPERRLFMSHGVVSLSPARAAELQERMRTLIEEFESGPGTDASPFGMVLAFYPLPPAAEATDD